MIVDNTCNVDTTASIFVRSPKSLNQRTPYRESEMYHNLGGFALSSFTQSFSRPPPPKRLLKLFFEKPTGKRSGKRVLWL